VQFVSLEALRDTYHCIQAIQNTSAGHSISVVEFTTPVGTAIATSQTEVEATLSTTLQTHFTKAHGSPFLKWVCKVVLRVASTSV